MTADEKGANRSVPGLAADGAPAAEVTDGGLPGNTTNGAESSVTGAARPVHAVGIGPGNSAYLHPRARAVLDGADVVVGFDTVLDHVEPPVDADCLRCSYDSEARQLRAFANRVSGGETGVAALMGDPNVSGYTFVEKVEDAVDRPVRVIPGISSLQVAASRARTRIERSVVVTLHARGDLGPELSRLVAAAGDRHLLVIPRPSDYVPERIASVLVERGVDAALQVHVYERLTFADETATQSTLGELAARDGGGSAFGDLSVVVVRADDAS